MSELVVPDDKMALIRKSVAPTATDQEFEFFVQRCRHMNLDPFKPGQVHFVKYGGGAGTIIVGLDGFRSRAAATGKHRGTKRGAIRDESGKLVGAWAEVYREGWAEPAREEVPLSEYNTNKGNWQKMPETMIKKVAEVAALRIAFPDDLGGLYSHEEMDQAREVMPIQAPATKEEMIEQIEGVLEQLDAQGEKHIVDRARKSLPDMDEVRLQRTLVALKSMVNK